ncbi:ABC transporter permease subunit [Mycolicibacterium sp. BiH015]|uniref:ABC transporter permease n=1 Tax=Mycolicibacterium sp. BiH015 TaxID=3018808 RepID=UPI0022E6ED82|nr:ABC transporter permease subunit [Mycolicibacterium sp. BiH015]MDA2891031.1 ABC transporter permease subunit [Mycolicibacterium sp. BiH015]
MRERALTAVLTPAVLIVAWQLSVWAGLLDFRYLPSPLDIAVSMGAQMGDGALTAAVGHTLSVMAAAAALAVVMGTAIGAALGMAPGARAWVEASIDVFRTVPAIMLIPVAVLTFGPSTQTEVVLAGYAALWPMVLNTAGAVTSVHPHQIDVARTLHLGTFATLRKIVLPAAAPVWLVGARMSAILALLVTIVVEMVITPKGLGGALVQALNALDPARMWAYAVVCGLIGILVNLGLRAAYRFLLPGHPSTSVSAPVTRASVPALRGLLPLAVLLVLWQVWGQPTSLSLPPPAQWFSALNDLFVDGSLAPAIGHTLTTYVSGLALAAVVGGSVGAAIGASQHVNRALSPTLDFLAAIPGAALVPVLVLLLGPNLASGIVAVATVVTWPIMLSTAAARRAIPPVRLDMSRTIGLSPRRRWCSIVLPSLAPGTLLGVRVASSVALIIALLTDIFGSGAGIGRLLIVSQQHFDAAAAWGLLLVVGCIGYLSNVALAAATRVFSAGIRQVASAG